LVSCWLWRLLLLLHPAAAGGGGSCIILKPHPLNTQTAPPTCVGLQNRALSPPGSSFFPTSISSSPSGENLSAWWRPTSVTQTLSSRSMVIMWGM
jgi:hypothetical protein